MSLLRVWIVARWRPSSSVVRHSQDLSLSDSGTGTHTHARALAIVSLRSSPDPTKSITELREECPAAGIFTKITTRHVLASKFGNGATIVDDNGTRKSIRSRSLTNVGFNREIRRSLISVPIVNKIIDGTREVRVRSHGRSSRKWRCTNCHRRVRKRTWRSREVTDAPARRIRP